MSACDDAWKYIWEKLFFPGTNLFYDYLADGVSATAALPTPEEIAMQFPNPCGWGTGMEDSMMSAGSMLETLLCRFEKEKDPEFARLAHLVFAGMKHCASVSSDPGFLPRSVSPVDGVSHYINSSRDQYTHFVYGAWKFYHSSVATAEEKRDVETLLAAFADRCIRNVTPENEFDLLREDGKPGLVTRMWGDLGPHEEMRLPMFYLAAYDVTGESRFRAAGGQWIREALLRSQRWSPDGREWFAFELLQMQYSLRLVWELDDDERVRAALLDLMTRIASYSQKFVLEIRERLRKGDLKPDAVNPNWRKRFFYLSEGRLVHGRAYFVPRHEETYLLRCFEPLRAAGHGVIIQKLTPGWSVAPEQIEALDEIIAGLDYSKLSCYAPILLTGARFM